MGTRQVRLVAHEISTANLTLHLDATVDVVLRDGRTVHGRLSEVNDTTCALQNFGSRRGDRIPLEEIVEFISTAYAPY